MKVVEENKITEGRGHTYRGWLVDTVEAYGTDDDVNDIITSLIEEDINSVMNKLSDFEEAGDSRERDDLGHYVTKDRIVQLLFTANDDLIEIELNPTDFGDFTTAISENDADVEIAKALPSAKAIIEKERAKDPEIDDESIFYWLDNEDFAKLSEEFTEMANKKVEELRPKVQDALKEVYGSNLRKATSNWTSTQVESIELELEEEKSNDEVARIVSKIADLEAELDMLINDKEVDEKEVKSVKSKIYNLNKKLNEGKDNSEEKNLSNIKAVLQDSGIKTPNTLERMSAAILKDLNTKYDPDTKDSDGIYYHAAIIDATQKLIEFITGKKPELEFGPKKEELEEARAKELLFADKELKEALSISKIEYDLPKYIKAQVDGSTEYLEISVAESPEKPEDYDEGYVTGWNKGEDPKYDTEQEQRYKNALDAYESGEVYQVRDVSDDMIIAVLYGNEEADDFLKETRAEEVDIDKLLKGM